MTDKDPNAPPEFTDAQLRWLDEQFLAQPVLNLDVIASPDFAIHYAYAAGQASVPVKIRVAIANMRQQRDRDKSNG